MPAFKGVFASKQNIHMQLDAESCLGNNLF